MGGNLVEKKMHTFVLLFWNQTYLTKRGRKRVKALVLG